MTGPQGSPVPPGKSIPQVGAPPVAAAPPVAGSPPKEFQSAKYIHEQIDATRTQIKVIDGATEMLFLIVAGGLFLAGCVVLDHWIVPGGLGTGLRLTAFLILIVGLGTRFVGRVLPLLMYRINPLYAASLLERQDAKFRTGLINFWFLDRRRQSAPEAVLQAVEQRVAGDLMHVSVDAAVERRRLGRYFAIALLGLGLMGMYKFLSPKDPFVSVGRVILPWVDWGAPTRVEIVKILPEGADVYAGETLNVQARIRGLAQGEMPRLLFTSQDGSARSQPIEMQAGVVRQGVSEYFAVLPPGGQGFGQDAEFKLVAGDAESATFAIRTRPAPAINVAQVKLTPPGYTRQAAYVVESGDFEALEGTRVELTAEANRPIKARSAQLDFHCDNRSPLLVMDAAGTKATTAWNLSANPDDQHDLYYVVFATEDGRRNPKPTRHRVRIIRDLAPEIAMQEPVKDGVVPADRAVLVRVRAHDPDFGLAGVKVQVQRRERDMLDASVGELLKAPSEAPFEGTAAFVPEKIGLKPGDEIVVWAEARDVKTPQANVVKTERRTLRIGEPERLAERPKNPDQVARAERPNRGQNPGDPQDGADGKGEPGQPRPGERNGAEKEPAEPGPGAKGERPDPADKPNDNPREPQAAPRNDRELGGPKLDSQPKEGTPPGGEKTQPIPEGGKPAKSPEENPPVGPAGVETADNRKPESAGDVFEEVLRDLKKQGKMPEDPPQESPLKSDAPEPKTPEGAGSSKEEKKGLPQEGAGAGGEEGGKEGPKTPPPPKAPEPGKGGEKGEEEQGEKGEQPKTGNQGQGEKSATGGKEGEQGEKGAGGEQAKPGKSGNSNSQEGNSGKPDGQSGTKGSSGEAGRPGEEKQEGSGARQGPQQPKAGEKGTGETNPGAKPEGTGKKPDTQGTGATMAEGNQIDKQPAPPTGEKPDGEKGKPSGAADGQKGTAQQTPEPGQGRGNQTNPTSPEKEKPNAEGKDPNQNGGDNERFKGNAGEGKEATSKSGSPPPSGDKNHKPREKEPGSGEKNPDKSENNETSQSISDTESSAKGEDRGDKSGGGGEGGGQKANQKGTGGAGTNSPSDEGASQAPGSGQGETADKAGNKAVGDKQTGVSSKTQTGNGTETKNDTAGDKAGPGKKPADGGQAGAPPPGAEKAQPSNQGTPQQTTGTGGEPDPSSRRAPGRESGDDRVAQGGNKSPDRVGALKDGSNTSPEDKADLDYAKKATDMALRHLKNELEKDRPDPKLLQKLGWNKEELRRFVDQWEALRAQAEQVGPQGAEARRKLEDRLRGLGLTRSANAVRTQGGAGDSTERLQEAARFAPPAEYADQVDAFRSGVDGKLGPKKVN